MKDTAIKLFGKNITFPETKNTTNLPLFSTATATAGEEPGDGGSDHDHGLEEEKVNREDAQKDQVRKQNSEAKSDDKSVMNRKTPSNDEDAINDKPAKTETDGDQSKALKKPDKILPCPRCNSMDTKFCYYNNYNVNQPRHFCKSCQRYWTAGGTMRNMTVGAGRRKNKNQASQYQLLTISHERAAASDGVHGVPTKVLHFDSDSPPVDGFQVSYRGRENGDDCSSGSTVTTSNSVTEKMHDKNGFHPQVPCIPGVSWSYNPWNSAICPPGYPTMPIYPSPYWNYIHWLPMQNQLAQHLGKHSRDCESTKPSESEEPKKQKNSVLIPKTLRIDDPDEAAKSSIWATLGIKNENLNRGFFKSFQAKGVEKKHPSDITSPVLQANPAAFSRSICFQERA